MSEATTRRIYAASLSDYNSGRLHGEWIDVDGMDADDLTARIGAMLARSPVPGAEEWAIHDHEGFGDSLGEHSSAEEVVTLAALLDEHGPAWLAYRDYVGEYATAEGFSDDFCGEWESEEGYAEDLAEEAGYLKAMEYAGVSPAYFDVEKFAHDLFLGDCWSAPTPDFGVYVFRAS